MVQYNNVREKDSIAGKGAMLPDGGARFPDGYIRSHQSIRLMDGKAIKRTAKLRILHFRQAQFW